MSKIQLSKTFANLPPDWSKDPLPGIRQYLRKNREKLVVIDDDPTGSQFRF
jgi:hypothetical protein